MRIQRLVINGLSDRFAERNARSSEPTPLDVSYGLSTYDVRQHVDLTLTGGELDIASYGDPQGMLALRQALSAMYQEQYGVTVDPEHFLITDGAFGALTVALGALVEPGDEVILPSVYFQSYPPLVQTFGGRPVFCPLEGDGTYDMSALRKLLGPRTRAIVINSPSNPYNSITSRAKLEELAALDIPLVSDEVYAGLAYDVDMPSLVQVSQDHFVVSSLTKVCAAGSLRVGFVIGQGEAMERAWEIKTTTNFCTSKPSQLLAIRIMEKWSEISGAHRAWVRERRDVFVEECQRLGLRLGPYPNAGFYGVIDVSHTGRSTFDIACDLIDDYNLLIYPGIDFAAEDPGFLRVTFACATERLTETLARIATYLESRP